MTTGLMQRLLRFAMHERDAVAQQTVSAFGPEFEPKLEALVHLHRKLTGPRKRRKNERMRRGSGIEFVDHRAYELGDDPRLIDWNATERLGHLLLRINEEHEDRSVYVLVDASQSMGQGDHNCLRLAQELAAALGYLALADLDRVMVGALRNGELEDLPPKRGKGQMLSVMRFMRQLSPRGQTDLEASVKRFTTRYRRPGVVYLISDLFCPQGYSRALDTLRYAQHKVHLLHLVLPLALANSTLGDVTLIDSETGETLDVTITANHLEQYESLTQGKIAEIGRYCLDHQIGFTSARSSDPFEQVILNLLREPSPFREATSAP